MFYWSSEGVMKEFFTVVFLLRHLFYSTFISIFGHRVAGKGSALKRTIRLRGNNKFISDPVFPYEPIWWIWWSVVRAELCQRSASWSAGDATPALVQSRWAARPGLIYKACSTVVEALTNPSPSVDCGSCSPLTKQLAKKIGLRVSPQLATPSAQPETVEWCNCLTDQPIVENFENKHYRYLSSSS